MGNPRHSSPPPPPSTKHLHHARRQSRAASQITGGISGGVRPNRAVRSDKHHAPGDNATPAGSVCAGALVPRRNHDVRASSRCARAP